MISSQAILILQWINLGITVLFILAYIYKLCRLRHFAISTIYQKKYPRLRIFFCAIYALISVIFLILSIVLNLSSEKTVQQIWMIQGVGEIVDSVVLLLQSVTLRQQLKKQRPYTSLHLTYCVYLNLLCLGRIVIVAIQILTQSSSNFWFFFFFYLAFEIVAVLLLGYWIAKRQQLPQFQDNRKFNTDSLSNNSKLLMNKNIQISYLRKISEHFTYIRPTVAIQKDRFRIILEIYDVDARTSQEKRKSMNQKNLIDKMKTISDHLYSMNQLKQLYMLCGRFQIEHKLNFDGVTVFDFYQSLQGYLLQLFDNKKYYHAFLLKFFQVSEFYMQKFDNQLRNTIKGSQFDMFAHLDKNAPLVSVRVFKQLWIDDHYIFYIDVIAADGSFESRPMKRYNDFETFHNNLTSLAKKNYNGRYILPSLPKKYLFNGDQNKITHRRIQLQRYLRGITNDYNIMLKCPELRNFILQFLQCKGVEKIVANDEDLRNYYKNLEVFKGNITKSLTQNQYVTYYEFKFFQNGIQLKTIMKRFSDFVTLHQGITREMHNSQIEYKFVVLPQKHIYKSDQHRHQKLKNYIENVLQIKNPWEIYPVNSFFGLGTSQVSFEEYSSILNNQLTQNQHSRQQVDQYFTVHSPALIDSNSISSKNRMSAMIDQLGF